MPHYSDGTPAKVGDYVKGRGYNLKGKDGNLREIVGVVVGIVPESSACNVRVAVHELEELTTSHKPSPGDVTYVHDQTRPALSIRTTIEYGETAHFVKVG